MKKAAILFALTFIISGCCGCSENVNIDELISARELPEYTSSVDIEVTESDDASNSDNNEVIVIE